MSAADVPRRSAWLPAEHDPTVRVTFWALVDERPRSGAG